MRKLIKIERQPFRDDYEIELGIEFSRGSMIERNNILPNVTASMIDGENRIDLANNRPVTKIDGKLNKMIVDENSEIRYEEIT